MGFYTPCGMIRPIRLSKKTRCCALESLNHKYGLDTLKTRAVTLDHIDKSEFDKMSALERQDAAICEIVTKAPIRICDSELISGAATLCGARGVTIKHE